jgi:hypothetical protein
MVIPSTLPMRSEKGLVAGQELAIETVKHYSNYQTFFSIAKLLAEETHT